MNYILNRFIRNLKNIIMESNLKSFVVVLSLFKLIFVKNNHTTLRILTRVLRNHPNIPFNKTLLNYSINTARINNASSIENNSITLHRSIIIKPFISEIEKGIILMKFEAELEKAVNSKSFEYLQNKYHFIFLPSWSGLFTPPLLKLAARSNKRFYVMPVNVKERSLCSLLGSYCKSLPFNAASWVKKELFKGHNGHRDINCLMVANFASFKRHWILFKALSKLPKEINAVCVGTAWGGRTADSLKQEADEYGVLDRVVVVEEPSQEELRIYFQRAKVFCALSQKEGSYISVAESLISGTPVIMFKNASIGTKELIGSNNGALVSSISDLRKKIIYFQQENNHVDIRIKAQEQVDADLNCNKLNKQLRNDALELGYQWTQDIESIYCVRLSFYYENLSWRHRLKKDYVFFKNNGIELKDFI